MRSDVIAMLGFVAFVLAILLAMRLPSDRVTPSTPTRAVRFVIVIGSSASLLAGFSERSLWPFASWRMIPLVLTSDVSVPALVCIGAGGSVHNIDYRAWAPLTEEEMEGYFNGPFLRLPPVLQDSARAELLAMAESSRERVRAGGNASASPSVLGTWGASSHLLHPRRWSSPGDAPPDSCTSLRLVEHRWNVKDVAAGRGSITDTTIWEYPRSP
jgi:hypothetical protein